ncbi:MAG TPA: cyanophycinase [Anaerolineales bacterium]|nr:cyanophycinase [Anaerolineales bacterium]HNH79141.1 cyanophycinase [Anaerolineales bacterium]
MTTTTLMPMGGALDERKDPTVLQEFLRRAGGKKARIVILPQASARRDTGKEYIELFKAFGAKEVVSFEFRKRSEAGTAEQIKLIRKASGIFFSGGTQMRIAAAMGGTALEAEIHAAYRRGCIVGGTSAGASILSKTMIAYGNGGPTPRERIIQFSAGLGFTDKFIFDQHFRQRDRLGRLIYAVSSHPGVIGVGIDEDTAAIVEDNARLTVAGSGAVTIVDGFQIADTDVAEIEHGGAVAVSNLLVHVLTHNSVFDGRTRKAALPKKKLLID